MIKMMTKAFYLRALRFLSKIELRKNKNATIIGITGSSGKSTSKELLVGLLKPHYKERLKYTKKGNSETGIPYEILNIPVRHYKMWEYPWVLLKGISTIFFSHQHYDVFVIEYGIDSPHSPQNMEYLLSIVKPHIGVLLSISPVHGSQFEDAISSSITGEARLHEVNQSIALEKAKLLSSIPHMNNALVTQQAAAYISTESLKHMTVITSKDVENTIAEWENTSEGISFAVNTSKGKISTFIPNIVLPSAAKMTITIAVRILSLLKKDLRTSLAKLPENYSPDPGRSTLLPGLENSVIIDSSYNANPMAAVELFSVCKEVARKGRRKKIIVLGDLRELGTVERQEYERVVTAAAKASDILILTNSNMKNFGIPAAEQAGKTLNENLYWFENGKQLSFHILEVIEPQSVVLFEGSQNTVFLEYAVKELCANKDPEFVLRNIPRMTKDWLEIK